MSGVGFDGENGALKVVERRRIWALEVGARSKIGSNRGLNNALLTQFSLKKKGFELLLLCFRVQARRLRGCVRRPKTWGLRGRVSVIPSQ